MIEFKNTSKIFNASQQHSTQALKPTDINISKGEFVVVVGANGSGKSTFLNLLAGTIMPTNGEIYLNGKAITALRDFERSKWIARVFQNPLAGTAPELSILDNFRLASLRTQIKKLAIGIDKKFVDEVKEKVHGLQLGLEDKLLQPMGILSGGQRQALTLLMATMQKPHVLLLDEPVAALDPRSAAMVMEIAHKIITEQQITAILVTHHLKDACTYGNRLLRFENGNIIDDLNAEKKRSITMHHLFEWFN